MKRPDRLHKFMSAPRFLERGLMRFTQPSQLNDPLEAMPGLRVGAYSQEDISVARAAARSSGFAGARDDELEALFLRPFPARRFDEKSFPGLWPAVEKRLREAPFPTLAEFDEAVAERAAELIAAHADATVGILSLSETETDALWAYYAAGGRGVRVDLDANHPFFADGLEAIHYSDEPISVSINHGWVRVAGRPLRTEDVLERRINEVPRELLLRKRMAWSHEREWRALRPLAAADESSAGMHLFAVPEDVFTGLVFGHAMSDRDVEKSLELVNDAPKWRHLKVGRRVRTRLGITVETLR